MMMAAALTASGRWQSPLSDSEAAPATGDIDRGVVPFGVEVPVVL